MIEAAACAEPIESFLCLIWWAAINIFVFYFELPWRCLSPATATSLSLALDSLFERTRSTVFFLLPTKMTEPSRLFSSTELLALLILNTYFTTWPFSDY